MTGRYETEVNKLKEQLREADAVIVEAGSGLSTSARYDFGGDRLRRHFGDFVAKYGIWN